MRRRQRIATCLAAALMMALVASPSPAAGRPELVIGAGRTLAVKGEPGGGGMALGVSVLWTVEDHFRVGVMGFADGLGERVDRLIGPGGVDLGPVAGAHRAAQGVVMRLEAHLAGAHRVAPFAVATWGFYRLEDDQRGALIGADEAAGIGLGAGFLHPFNEHHAAGLSLRGHLLSRGGAGRYLGAALEWRWSAGAGD